MPEPKYENEFIKHLFTESEKKDIADDMAQKVVTLQQTEDDIKAIKSDYKSQTDGIQAGINSAATKLTAGYEMRSIKCQVLPNYEKKVWEYIQIDTDIMVKTKDMTASDLQMKLEE